jgi:hypothetical protein
MCSCVCECVCVCGGDNSVYGGRLVLLVGVCEQRMLLAGHHTNSSIISNYFLYN